MAISLKELWRNALIGAKVPAARRIQRKRRVHAVTHVPSIVVHGAQIPKGPARDLRSVPYTRSVRLKEVNFVDWISVYGAGKKGKEDEEDGAGY